MAVQEKVQMGLESGICDHDRDMAVSAARGNRQAEEILIRKYSRLVYSKCRTYYVIGADKEDLAQEGMIGLMEAIRAFSPDKDITFRSFAEICITCQILSAVKAGSRLKHTPLNESLSLDHCPEDSDALFEILPDQGAVNPEERVIHEEERRRLHESVNSLLTWQEQVVFTAYMAGYSYENIAGSLRVSVKAVDNSLQRVKRKIRQKQAWRI